MIESLFDVDEPWSPFWMIDVLYRKHQRRVVSLRFGLCGKPRMTLEQIAQDIGVTRERVRQIETISLALLRRAAACELPPRLPAEDVPPSEEQIRARKGGLSVCQCLKKT